MKSNFTNNDIMHPDDISQIFAYTVADNYDQKREIDGGMIYALYNLKTIAENPFNDESYRVLYDVLSCIASKLYDRDYLQ